MLENGSHLVERLLKQKVDVTVLDNFSTGRKQNLSHLDGHEHLHIFEEDVSDFEAVNSYFSNRDWVFHLAALADIIPSIQNPLEYYRANVDGTVSVLEAARQAGVNCFIYAASSSCYGIADVFPTPETATIRPMYPYVLHWNQVYKCHAFH